ncbi:hypothetical protein STEG23_023491, partial [Scotinomys teguina]
MELENIILSEVTQTQKDKHGTLKVWKAGENKVWFSPQSLDAVASILVCGQVEYHIVELVVEQRHPLEWLLTRQSSRLKESLALPRCNSLLLRTSEQRRVTQSQHFPTVGKGFEANRLE